MKILAVLGCVMALSGCMAVDAAVGIAGAVVETGVEVTGTVVETTVDVATSPLRSED